MKIQNTRHIPYTVTGSWRAGNPFALAFWYPYNDEPVFLTGGINEIDKALVRKRQFGLRVGAYWYKGKARYTSLQFINPPVGFSLFIYKAKNGFDVSVFEDRNLVFQHTYRKCPRGIPRDVVELLTSRKALQ
jgi:hypothetical protein